jgi:hypothetical protein
VPAGTYYFKITFGNWDNAVGTEGYSSGCNIGFNILASSDNIAILFDSATGRHKITNDNPGQADLVRRHRKRGEDLPPAGGVTGKGHGA